MKRILLAIALICSLVGTVSCFHGNETDAALDFAMKLNDTSLISGNIVPTKVNNDNALQIQAAMQLDQARIDYDSGDYKSAYDHLLSYTRYQDTIYQYDSKKKLMDLQRKYNYTKRERERDHERLTRQKMTIISLVAVILLSLGSIVLYLHMSRKNRLLTDKMTHAHNELNYKTSQLEHKSQMLDRFKTRIIESDRVVSRIDAMRNMTAAQLIRSSDNLMLTDNDIDNLERLINECDNGLIDKLRMLSPKIGTQDVALCCLLRLNVDKQNCAALLGVSDAALRKRKYRLRTDKLGNVMPEVDSLDNVLDVLARSEC
ncbi:MAG: hypothetical protein K2M65_04415 [Muribaculaceae bacterium]|nr:hypothetical protein [Muribaculaceae bacterium]